MREFAGHEQAVDVAQSFLDTLLVEAEPSADDLVDEELLGRIMRGEETAEANLEEFAAMETMKTGVAPVSGRPDMTVWVEKKLARRDLLCGSFLGEVRQEHLSGPRHCKGAPLAPPPVGAGSTVAKMSPID